MHNAKNRWGLCAPGRTKGAPNTTIQSAKYNALVDDLTLDANAARPITAGGTGATSASAARTALGLAIGTNVQAYDSDLTALSAITIAADQLAYGTGAATWGVTAFTAFARSLLDDVDAAAVRTTLGLGALALKSNVNDADWSGTDLAIANGGTGASTAAAARTALGVAVGTDVQAFDADLTAIAALSTAADQLPYATGASTWALTSFTAFARTILDDADAATARGTLGAAASAQQINAGAGMSGGGTLAADRTITMGTPGTLTASTANSATGTTHTHAVDEDSICGVGNAALPVGAQGTWGLFKYTGSGTLNPGSTTAGSNLEYARVAGDSNGSSPGGTWRCMGFCQGGGSSGSTTVFLRT